MKRTVNIRISKKSKAALDMVCAELSLLRGHGVTLDDGILYLVDTATPHISERIAEITDQRNDDSHETNGK